MAKNGDKAYVRSGHELNSTSENILEAVIRFHNAPHLHRKIIGNYPRYFAFTRLENEYVFALSKFCAFKKIDCKEYLTKIQGVITSGNTREHIEKIMRKKWLPEKAFGKEIQQAFRLWIEGLYGHRKLDHFKLMEIDSKVSSTIKRKRKISPETLFKQLEAKRMLGMKGEEIAIKYEINRLIKNGCKFPKDFIDHVSKRNAAAGYDILSTYKADRYIEVKATSNDYTSIYITQNEYEVLKDLGAEAYLYLVVFKNGTLKSKVYEIQNPIPWLESNCLLSAQVYKATLSQAIE